MDYARAILFCKKNHFTHEQTDELILIIKDVQHQAINECGEKTIEMLEKKYHV